MGRWRDTHSTVDLNGYEGTFMVSYFDSLGGFFFGSGTDLVSLACRCPGGLDRGVEVELKRSQVLYK